MESPLRLARPLLAEALGTAILVATVVGSGIMAEPLAGGNQAIALLGNTLPMALFWWCSLRYLLQSQARISTRL
jgi:glycerol uptake facilitator-like aquaporin